MTSQSEIISEGLKSTVAEGDLTWGGERTTQDTDDVLFGCTLET